MARAGVAVDESIACVGIGAGEAADRLLELTTSSGQYRAVGIGADRFQFARSFRPTWAIACTCLFIWALGLGLLFLLVKSSETWVATIEQDHRSTRIRVTGKVLPGVLLAVRSALQGEQQRPQAVPSEFTTAPATGVASAAPAAVPMVGPPPGLAAAGPIGPPPGMQPQPMAPQPQPVQTHSPVAPQPVAPQPVTQPVTQPVAPQPVAPQPVTQPVAPVLWLELDTGAQLQMQPFTLIGRDPVPTAGDPQALLVPVDDPGRSVSKTHIALVIEPNGVRVVDRHSTNGTVVEGPFGTRQVTPDHPQIVEPGATVRFGDRWVRLHAVHGAGSA